MKLERHVGGLSRARKLQYLRARGWREAPEDGGNWTSDLTAPLSFPLDRAVHHQLTEDLTRELGQSGWRVLGYSPRGYVKLEDPLHQVPACSLPKALRTQARREKRLVGEFTYALFLAALLEEEEGDGPKTAG